MKRRIADILVAASKGKGPDKVNFPETAVSIHRRKVIRV